MNWQKYQKAYFDVPITEREWPKGEIKKAPIWCSVDLRDGNQALFSPMTIEEKIEFFNFLVKLGFKEIEVGFPAASETEFKFVRALIEGNLIPDDVSIQVLTQARDHIIRKALESVKGAENVIVHFYNSTSKLQREVVFGKSEEEIIEIAREGAILITELTKDSNANIRYEYSPESFTCTEPDFAIKICNEVIDIIKPSADKKLIINLPSSIEVSTPNVFADQIEYVSTHLKNRENICLSVHAHNDRGTAVAASELAILAGAQRVEGTLFGNGERTGNADIVTIALNMFVHGIDPGLNLESVDSIIEIYEKCNKLPINPRHPYAGEMSYTAFSGSHQDAIKKSMDYATKSKSTIWKNPYLTINPTDIAREYEPIRINSQSGKGGLHYIMENKFGYSVPKPMLQEFSSIIKKVSDAKHTVLTPKEIFECFTREYMNLTDKIVLENYDFSVKNSVAFISAELEFMGEKKEFSAEGNGPLDALSHGLTEVMGEKFEIVSYNEHALERSSSASAVSYIAISNEKGETYWGAGVDSNINTSSFLALISACNKML